MRLLLLATSLLFPAGALANRPIDEYRANIERGAEHAPGELLLRTHADVKTGDVHRVARKLGCKVDHRFGHRPFYMVLCRKDVPMSRHILRWQDEPIAEWVEAGFYDDELEAVPNDLATLQWYHFNNGQTIDTQAGVPGADMSSVDAWDVTPGSPTRKVALIDVGIYQSHVDLMNQLWVNPGETCGNFIDDDGNGYVDDCNGWDVGDSDNDPSPLTMPETRTDGSACLRWHATYIAGLVGAQGNNNAGIAGTTWDVDIINIKRHRDSTCRSTTTRTVEAITYAMDQGADAIGMSFSGSSYSSSFQTVLTQADNQGMIAVMSAGNGGSDIDNAMRYPNNYTMNKKVIVAATDNRDQLDLGSNYGSQRVTLAAPGTLVVSTAIQDPQAYGYGTGTSMSVGFVLGAITLTYAAYPQITPDQVMSSILNGSQYLSNLDCAQTTRCVSSSRRLDLDGTLAEASTYFPPNLSLDQVSLSEIGNGDGTLQPGEQARLVLDVSNNGTGPSYATGTLLQLDSNSPDITIPTPESTIGTLLPQGSAQGHQGPVFQLSGSCSADFTATFRLTVADTLGNGGAWTFDVDFTCAGAPPVDAGVPDSGAPPPDGGTPIQPDATVTPDAAAPNDSGTVVATDGGNPADAAVTPDATPAEDAGQQTQIIDTTGRRRPGACGCNATDRSGPASLSLLLLFVLLFARPRPS